MGWPGRKSRRGSVGKSSSAAWVMRSLVLQASVMSARGAAERRFQGEDRVLRRWVARYRSRSAVLKAGSRSPIEGFVEGAAGLGLPGQRRGDPSR